MNEQLLVTVEDAAKALSLSRAKVYEMIAAGELESVRYDGMRRVAVDTLRRWIDEHREGGRALDAPPVQPTTKWLGRRRGVPRRGKKRAAHG